jgi:hypothetical protein
MHQRTAVPGSLSMKPAAVSQAKWGAFPAIPTFQATTSIPGRLRAAQGLEARMITGYWI